MVCNIIFIVQRLDGPLASNSEDTNFILLTGIWVVVALALYFMRPNAARTDEATIKKLPRGGSNGGSDVWIKLKPFNTIKLLYIHNFIFLGATTTTSSINGSSLIMQHLYDTFYKHFEFAQS